LRPEVDAIHKLGAELVVVGNGKPLFASAFREDMNLDTPLYVDPKLATYKAAGLKRGIWRTIGPPAWMNGIRAFSKGFRQSSVKGDPWQEGGVFVVLPNGNVPYSYISEAAGDHPDPKEVISALRTAVKEA
jgi:hypothetical protein